MPFAYKRTVRFQDTDAAGVVYFANVLSICHEACEESLAVSGINLKSFFSNQTFVTPVVHASVDFFRPMYCGDRLTVHLTPQQVASDTFENTYQIFIVEKQVAKAITRHVCINPTSRTRQELPTEMIQWLHKFGEKD